MSLLALLAARQEAVNPDPPVEPWEPPTPFPVTVPGVPKAAPWHMADPLVTPTWDGYGQALHPSVVDFGGKWNGYRFWMAYTPYPRDIEGVVADHQEDPQVAASNDCLTWTPIGPQPIQHRPTNGYNSDVEMVYEPTTDTMHLWWRPVQAKARLVHAVSTDGCKTWSSPVTQIDPFGISPCIIRYAANDWRMWYRVDDPYMIEMRTAPSPDGPWSAPVPCTSTGADISSSGLGYWHAGIARHKDGRLFQLAHTSARTSDNIHAATSTDDGKTWKWGATPVLGKDPSSSWARESMYRPYPVLHENGTHMRVWYAGLRRIPNGGTGWRIGYTELPLSLWPS